MTKILDLPRKLENDILSRVPLKSMRAVRLTCTKWNTLSKSRSFSEMRRSFSEMHIAKAASTEEGESTMIVSMDYNLYLVSVVVNENPSVAIKGKLVCLDEQVKISKFFHCNGLLLCILKDNTKFVVWNPYSGQTRWIEPRYVHQMIYGCNDRFRYAIGYANKKNTSCRSYKVLRFLDDTIRPHGNYRTRGDRFIWYEIYDFDSDSWTTLDVPLDWYIMVSQRGVSLKGNTYWCATKNKEEEQEVEEEEEGEDEGEAEEELDDHLICFDFSSEKFGPLMRMPFNAGHNDYVNLSCVKEEKLAVLLTHNEMNPFEVEIWITTKIEPEKVTWSKFLTLNTEPEYPISSRSFFIDEEKKVVMGFDEDKGFNQHKLSIVGEDKYLRILVLGERVEISSRFSTNMCSYVPSLAQIKQSVGGKRKQQSDLEKRRFDEKMSRLVALETGVKE